MSGLYSPINRAAESITRPKGTGAEYMAELQKKPGYKPAEAEDRDLQTLMALPQMERAAFMEKLKAQANKFPLKHRELGQGQTHHESYTLPGGENYREILLHTPMPEGQGFPGVPHHFGGTPNILASIRVKDRTTPEGKKMLHLEEIQSDWHQQGREKGYDTKIKEPSAQEREEWRVLDNIHPNNRTQEQYARLNYLDHLMAKEPFGVPYGPHAKDWHELALKAMIQHAAENGYDQIAVTPGAEQAKRYSLSRHVDDLHYFPEEQKLMGYKDKRKVVDQSGVAPKDLQKHIGKTAAETMLAQPTGLFGSHQLTGEGLAVGEEGMKGFYDRMVPSFLNKFGKKHGVQVQQGAIGTGEHRVVNDGHADLPHRVSGPEGFVSRHATPEEAQARAAQLNQAPVHTFDITPAMREDILKNGIPRYADGGTVDPMGNYSDATDSPITDDLTAKPVAVSIPARIQAYRPDPTGKYGGKDGLETLPTEFRTNTLMDYAKAAGLASSMGYKQPTPDQLTNLALQEGARSDFGHNRSLSYDHPDVSKLISEGIAPDSAAFAILAHQKMQTANRLKIPFERAWNGTGRSEFGKTGKDYANSIAAGSYAANHPKNKQLADLIRQSYDSGKSMHNFDPGQGNDWATGGIIHKAEGGSMNLTTQQMRAALMHNPNTTSLNTLQSIGAQEAPSLPVKEFIAPHGAPTYGSIPVGGIDENLQQPGQQMSPQQPQQQGQQPQGGTQPPQGQPQPQQGSQSNILSMTPQGQAMAAMRPTGMATGGGVQGYASKGYVHHTDINPHPEAGQRYSISNVGRGLAPINHINVEDMMGGSFGIAPWDTSGTHTVHSVSGHDLINDVDLEGGQNFSRKLDNIAAGRGGASGIKVVEGQQDRINRAISHNLANKGTGKVYTSPMTMGADTSSNFSHMPIEIQLDLMHQAGLSPDEINDLTHQVRALKGMENFVGFDDPNLWEHITRGDDRKVKSIAQVRKAMTRVLASKEAQKRLNYNFEDLVSAITDPDLRNTPKNYTGRILLEGHPTTIKDTQYTTPNHTSYSTGHKQKFVGGSHNLPVELWMPDSFAQEQARLLEKNPKLKTHHGLRDQTINSLAWTKNPVGYQPINERVVRNIKRFEEGQRAGDIDPNDMSGILDYYRRKHGGYKKGGGVKLHTDQDTMALELSRKKKAK